MTTTDDGPGGRARPPHPDGEPGPVEIPDFRSPHRDLDWELPGYQGLHRHRGRSRTRKKEPRWYRPRNTVGIPVLVVLLVLVGALLYVNAEMSGIRRAPLAPSFTGAKGAGTNVLLVASRSPAHSLAADPDTMVVQLVHLSASGENASVVNLPSDLYLPDPTAPGGSAPSLRLVDLYAAGGIPLLGQAVQHSLGLTVDHYVQIGFAGYVRVTDRLGGVDMPSDQGLRHFTGAQAERYTSDATVTSIVTGQRNQQWLKAMLSSAMTPGVLLNPFTMVGLLKDTKPNLVLDEAFTNGALRGLLWKARHLRPSTIRYLTAPYRGYASRVVQQRAGQAGQDGGTDQAGRPGRDDTGTAAGTDGSTGPARTRVGVLLPDLAGLRQLGEAIRADNESGIAVFDN